MLEIRRYQQQDNEVVKELHYAGLLQMGVNRAYNPNYDYDIDDIEHTYINNEGDFLVGLEGQNIVVIGAIRKETQRKAEIKRIKVRREYQRRGYGEAILSRLIERAKELKYEELYLDTLASNMPAQALFEKHGFTQTQHGKVGP
jgi:ribosomal protein S18 acetylase RimI-like enzyme